MLWFWLALRLVPLQRKRHVRCTAGAAQTGRRSAAPLPGGRRLHDPRGSQSPGMRYLQDERGRDRAARAVACTDPAVPEVAQDQVVQAVLARQQAILAGDYPEARVIIGEGALRQQAGGAKVMRSGRMPPHRAPDGPFWQAPDCRDRTSVRASNHGANVGTKRDTQKRPGVTKPQVSTGAPPGTRTPNPRIKSPLLCQLS